MTQPQSNIPGSRDFRAEFTRLIARPEEDLDLGRAALLVAGEEYPGLDVEGNLRLLDSFAEAVRQRMPGDAHPPPRWP